MGDKIASGKHECHQYSRQAEGGMTQWRHTKGAIIMTTVNLFPKLPKIPASANPYELDSPRALSTLMQELNRTAPRQKKVVRKKMARRSNQHTSFTTPTN